MTDSPKWVFVVVPPGGEAFIPRRGNAKRSAAILDLARRWYRGEATS